MTRKESGHKSKASEVQLVIFRLKGEEFGTEIAAVVEISRMLDITRIPDAPGFIEGVINLRGRVLAVIDMARQLGFGRVDDAAKAARIIIVDVGSETVGLMVDEVPEVLRVAESEIEPPPEFIQSKVKKDYVKGVAKLDERLIILLDLTKVLASEEVIEAGKLMQRNESED